MSAIRRAPLSAWLAPEYPGCSIIQARWLRQGLSPREISRRTDAGSDLSSAEAHRWLSAAPQTAPLHWLSQRLLRGLRVSRDWTLRSWLVARWLERVLAAPAEYEALTRSREFVGPQGARVRVRFADRLDEIQDVDLDRGIATGVMRTFSRAAERVGEGRLEELAADHRVLAEPPQCRLGARARALVTPAELVAEGREMRHCVGGYSHAVEHGHSVIVSIRSGRHRSTLEMAPDGRVLQHRGRGNATPDSICCAVARSVSRRMGGKS